MMKKTFEEQIQIPAIETLNELSTVLDIVVKQINVTTRQLSKEDALASFEDAIEYWR